MPETEALYERICAAYEHQPLPWPQPIDGPFVGRELELGQIANLLANPACRVLTIVGFGGMGKTRLAQQAVQAFSGAPLRPFLNGIAFVDLVGLAQADTLAIAIAHALGLTFSGDAEPSQELTNYLRNKEILLLLDNFEHLLDGADFLTDLLAQCPDIKLLITSREPLNLSAEWRLDLGGLDYAPDQEKPKMASHEISAVQLFVNCVQQDQPDFELTAEHAFVVRQLCDLLAGIPLALKLAAPLLRSLTLPQIMVQVQQNIDLLASEQPNVPLRQRSMRAIYDYTWMHLDATEQSVLAHLSIFRGGFTEEAAATVAGATPFVLAMLLDRGLLQFQLSIKRSRYVFHELTRQYAAEKLTAQELAHGQAIHATFFADFAEQQYRAFHSHHFQVAVEEIALEFGNVDAMWQWLMAELPRSSERELPGRIRQMVPMVAIYYEEQSLFLPGLRRFDALAKQMELAGWGNRVAPQEQQIVLAVTRYYWARLHQELGNYAEVERLTNAVLPVLERFGVIYERALTLTALGRASFRLGNYALARSQLQTAAQSLRHSGCELDLARALSSLASVASNQGHYAQAEAIHKEVLAIYRRLDYTSGIVRTLGNLGGVYNRQGRFQESRPLLEEARAIAGAKNLRARYMFVTSNLGSATSGEGNYTLAEKLYRESLALARELGDQRWIAANLNGLARNYIRMGNHNAAIPVAGEGLSMATAIHSQPDTLSSISFLGRAWAHEGRVEDALHLLLFAAEHPTTMEWDVRFNRGLIDELRQELPDTLYHQAENWCAEHGLYEVVRWIQARLL